METKGELINAVKEWVKIDSEIAALQKEISSRRKEKKTISFKLMQVMKSLEIDAFDLKEGQLVYKKTTSKKPINKSTLYAALNEYFGGNVDKAGEISAFIMDKREETTKEIITRKSRRKPTVSS